MTKFSPAIVCAVALLAAGCGDGTQQAAQKSAPGASASLPENPRLTLNTQVRDPNFVRFTVSTNLPTPLAAMASLDLQGQKDNDTAIGAQQKITLTGPTTVFDVKAVDNENGLDQDRPLPKGRYDADLIVGPSWPENASISSLPNNIESKETILLGAVRSPQTLERQLALQKWVIENVPSDAPWSLRRFQGKLGLYKKSAATLSPLHDAYYFPQADVTLIVNRVQNKVSIWRLGKATE